ncbi:serine hydrolase domain-containing protein [[Actinomadura] parvosata]|uniref:serine hydrolase domain-containing protein n=1 Tax=[Actinomadura] parvosata TaxID=1955412 RepID=UPI001E362F02|nr:serine hydrolase domain-containing protein [Nonomuraea sp. ATCC 55076]
MTMRRRRTFASRLGAATLAAALLAAGPATAATAQAATAEGVPAQGDAAEHDAARQVAAQDGAALKVSAQDGGLDRARLRETLEAVHAAGMYGIYSHVVQGRESWKGAAGVADVETGRPVRPDMVHRIGSITKTFTAVAVLQQVGRGRIDLDAPIGRYLPDVVPGERGQRITVRMLLNHTSHIANSTDVVFPTVESLDANRFRTFPPEELARLGLEAPATGEPGALPGAYSNTNYTIAGLLLERVTGVSAERYITDHVIRPAGLRHTAFPRTPHIPGPHSKAYEALYGLFDPPKEYSVYNMSWAGTAGALTSTMEDLSRFFRLLLRGELLDARLLAEMRTTVPVRTLGGGLAQYGLGLFPLDLPCGRFWGHDGSVPGMDTFSFYNPDSTRQVSLGTNLRHYQRLDENGQIILHPIDYAFADHLLEAVCGPDAGAAGTAAARSFTLPMVDKGAVTP